MSEFTADEVARLRERLEIEEIRKVLQLLCLARHASSGSVAREP